MIRIGHFLFRFRKFVFPAVFLSLVLAGRPSLAGGTLGSDMLLNAIGIAVALSGQLLRIAVIGFAYIKRGGKDRKIYANDLVTAGLFAHSRNPMYVGNMLIIAGLAIIDNSPWFYAIGIPFFVFAYWCITLAEEQYLHSRFAAQYDDYCRRVNRFLPSLRGLKQTLDGMTFDWRKVVRKEYGVPFIWVTAALGLVWWKLSANAEGYTVDHIGRALLSVWVVLVVAYGTARLMKKKGLLGSD